MPWRTADAEYERLGTADVAGKAPRKALHLDCLYRLYTCPAYRALLSLLVWGLIFL